MRLDLRRQLGPLKTWQWLLIAVAGVYLIRRRQAAADQAAADQAQSASGNMYGGGGPQGDPNLMQPGQQAPTAAASSGTQLDGANRVSVPANQNTVNVNLAPGLPTQGHPDVAPSAAPLGLTTSPTRAAPPRIIPLGAAVYRSPGATIGNAPRSPSSGRIAL